MTIASQTSRIAYTGDGTTTAFAVPFYFAANADLVVYLQDTLGNQTTQVLGTNYNLTGATLSAGGTCTFTTAPTTGYLVTVYRDPAVTQTTSYNNNDPFAAKSHELALDKLTTIAQRTKDQVSRAIHQTEGEAAMVTALASVATRKNKLLGFGTNGELIYPLGPSSGGGSSGSSVGVVDIDSRATAQVTTIAADINIVLTGGYTIPGDGGGGLYKRAVSQPSHPGKFQSAGGAWWELMERSPSPAMFGGDPTGVAGSSTAITNAVSYVVAKWGKGFIDCRGRWLLDTDTITITANDVVLGGVAGFGFAEFVRGHNSGPLFAFQSATPAVGYCVRSGLVNAFVYDSSAMGTFANSPYGVVFDLVNYPYFDNVKVTDECVAFRACANLYGNNIQIYHGGKTYAAGRKALYFGPSALTSPFVNYGGSIFLSNMDVVAGTISGTTIQPKADDAIYIENCDGINLINCHAIFGAFANLHIKRTDSATPCDNIEMANLYLDMGAGYGLRVDGTQICHNIKLNVTVSQIGLGSVGVDGVSIIGPCDRVTLDINVEGMKGNGIHVNNAGVSRLTIRPGHIYNIDSDDTGDGDGIYIQACTSASIIGGLIGGDGKTQSGIHLGSGATKVKVTGVKASDCDGWGCIIDSGATDFDITSNDFTGNTAGALLDGTSTSTPKLIKNNRGTIFYGSQTQTVGTLASGATASWNVGVAGAAYGDRVQISFDKDIGSCIEGASVSTTNTVKVKIYNGTGSSVTLGDVVATVEVEKRYSA